jgi:hypothetical protein
MIISVHAEDDPLIKANMAAAVARYGEDIPITEHPRIRSEEACFLSSSRAVARAKEFGTRLHVLHISTARELESRMTALIAPHEKILKGIEEAEQERVAQHESNIDTIIQMGRTTYLNSAQIQEYLDTLAEIDPTTFEEFTPKAAAECEIATKALEKLLQAALDHEAAEEERERQRVEAEEAERAQREQEIAEKAAAKAKAEAEAAAEDQIAAERARADAAEREAVQFAVATCARRSGRETPPEPATPQGVPTRAQRKALTEILTEVYLDTEYKEFIEGLLSGDVHPAITIDWSKVDG